MNNEIQKPTTFQLATRYTRALSRWIKAGRPVRNESEIIRIFHGDCRVCEDYDHRASSCQYCGCRVNESTIAPLNKIAMKTEHCPLEKW